MWVTPSCLAIHSMASARQLKMQGAERRPNGTSPRGLTMKSGSGGEENGPAVCPAAHSLFRYS